MTSKITGPLFKWFGSKWQASKWYPRPLTRIVCEPFAGSAGYSLRHYEKEVILAESNIHLQALWQWLINEATERDIRAIPVNLDVGSDIKALTSLAYGQKLLLKHWQRTNNVGDCWTVSPWGNLPGQWTENTRARVAIEVHAVKHWKICQDKAIVLFDCNRSRRDITWFIDPCYQYNYQYKCPTTDYAALADEITTLKGAAIACEAVCQKTGARPTYLPFVDFRKTVTSRRKQNENHHSRELIYTQPVAL